MTDMVQNEQPQAVDLTPEELAKLTQMAQKLEQDGEVLVQTAEDVGEETPATVH